MSQFIQVDPQRCIGCGTCLAACSQTHRQVGRQDAPRLALVKTKDVSAAAACHHCLGAPCVQVCPVQALSVSEQSVLVDETRCIGCKLCALSCPFGAITLFGTPVTGVAGTAYPTPTFMASLSPLLQWEVGVYAAAVKCDLCLFVGSDGPSCVRSCLSNALRLVDEPAQRDASKGKHLAAAASSARISFERLPGVGR